MCPSEETIQLFVEGDLPAPDAALLEEHLDGCEACFAAVAAMTELLEPAPEEPDPLAAGGRLGRYVVLGAAGEGRRRAVTMRWRPGRA